MGFLFGLLIGGMAVGAASTSIPSLGTIPFRCLAAFSASDESYTACRQATMNQELHDNGCASYQLRHAASGPCSVAQNIKWELAGLHELKTAAAKLNDKR